MSDIIADIVNDVRGGGKVAAVPRADIPVKVLESPGFHFLDDFMAYIGRTVVAAPWKPEQRRGVIGILYDPVKYLLIVFKKGVFGSINLIIIMAVRMKGKRMSSFYNF